MKKYEEPRMEVVEIESLGAILNNTSGGEIGGEGVPDANRKRNPFEGFGF